MTISKIASLCALCALLSIPSFAQWWEVPPMGRLTLTSSQPVMTSDVVNTNTVYYVPYVGLIVPEATGATPTYSFMSMTVGSPLTLTLTSSMTAGNIYDIFLFSDTIHGNWQIGVGPAWASSSSRGTGAGTTEIVREATNGMWMNAQRFTPVNGTISLPFLPVANATYLGSVYMTGTGTTSMQFKPTPASGGTKNVLGLYNAYNRVRTIASNNDSASTAWTYSTASYEALDNNTDNSISFLDGLQQSSIDAEVECSIYTSSSSVFGYIALALDSTTNQSPTGTQAGYGGTGNSSFGGVPVLAIDHFQPQLGFHYVAAEQYATGATVTFFNGAGGNEELKIELEM